VGIRPAGPVRYTAQRVSVINCVAYGADGHRIGDVPLADVSEVLKIPDRFVWVGLLEPNAELLRQVQEEFGLHDLAIEDALRAHQRPKAEEYGDTLFVVVRTAHWMADVDELGVGETHVFVGPQFVVTIRHGVSSSYQAVRSRCESAPHLLRHGPGFALYAILDFVVDEYFPVVDRLEELIEEIEERVYAGTVTNATTTQVFGLKSDLVALKRAVSPLIDVCNRLLRFDVSVITPDTKLYLRDVYDHVVRVNESIDTLRELSTGALEAHLALVSVQQNETMKKLAAGAAIIGVPTAIAGIYGMNFDHIPELHWSLGYPFALGLMALSCGVLYWRFRKAGWL
jgi:magnesium transporter